MSDVSADPISRRRVLTLIGSLSGIVTVIGCGETDVIVPEVDPKRKTKLEREKEDEAKYAKSKKKSR